MNSQNRVIRPIKVTDLPAIMQIAGEVVVGFTSLPRDEPTLKAKIDRSIASFAGQNPVAERLFFFILEEAETKEVMGTAAIEVSVGHPFPFYSYKISHILNEYHYPASFNKPPKLFDHKILYFNNDYQNTTELGSLYLRPTFRGHKNGELLSRMRFLFIAEHADFFSDKIMAEMHAYIDENGNSPFWEGVCKPFFGLSFREADFHRSVLGGQFIVDLMPKCPVYVDYLGNATQKAIAETHTLTKPALHLLSKEGFEHRGYIDIFDGGPIIEALKKDIKTVRESKKAIVSDIKKNLQTGDIMLLSNRKLDFRATFGRAQIVGEEKIILDEETAKLLEITVQDTVRFST